jgi:hypothetical protein
MNCDCFPNITASVKGMSHDTGFGELETASAVTKEPGKAELSPVPQVLP